MFSQKRENLRIPVARIGILEYRLICVFLSGATLGGNQSRGTQVGGEPRQLESLASINFSFVILMLALSMGAVLLGTGLAQRHRLGRRLSAVNFDD